jgi:MFS family permease
LPWLLLGIHTGHWIDKYSARKIVWVGTVLRIIGAVLLTAFLLGGWRSISVLCGLVFVAAIGEVMGDISAQAWVAHLERPAAYPVAYARLCGTQVFLGLFAGPAVAGLLLSVASFFATGTGAVLQLLSAMALRRIAPTDSAGKSTVVPADAAGAAPPAAHSAFELVRTDRCLLGIVLLGALSMLVYGMWTTAIVLFVTDSQGLGLPPSIYGLLMAVAACGSLLGSWLMPHMLRATNGLACVAASCFGTSVLPLGAALSQSVVSVGLSMFVYGLLLSAWTVSAVSFRQRRVPIHMLGRVTAFYRLTSWGAMPVGALLAGFLGAHTEMRFVFMVCALVSLLQYPMLNLVRELRDYRG